MHFHTHPLHTMVGGQRILEDYKYFIYLYYQKVALNALYSSILIQQNLVKQLNLSKHFFQRPPWMLWQGVTPVSGLLLLGTTPSPAGSRHQLNRGKSEKFGFLYCTSLQPILKNTFQKCSIKSTSESSPFKVTFNQIDKWIRNIFK